MNSEVVYPSPEKLAEWVEFWKPRLGLGAWRITVSVVPALRLNTHTASAEWWSNQENRVADIYLNRDEDYLPDHPGSYPHDPEFLVVHEMLHGVFDISREDHDVRDVLYEQGLNAVARALVELRRAGGG